MIIQLEKDIKAATKEKLFSAVNGIGYKTTEVKTQKGSYLVCIGKNEFDIRRIGSLEGVQDVHRVSEAYKLVSRKWKVGRTEIDLGDGVKINGSSLTIMAGPCSIESEEQVEKIVKHLVENNIKVMRGGVFKPRSSPYAFRGMGLDGLKMFNRLCRYSSNVE